MHSVLAKAGADIGTSATVNNQSLVLAGPFNYRLLFLISNSQILKGIGTRLIQQQIPRLRQYLYVGCNLIRQYVNQGVLSSI
jgi:hypothetical protein